MSATLHDILRRIPEARLRGNETIRVDRVVYDSRKVRPGDLFCAVRGEKADGNRFVQQAVKTGAAAILTAEASVKAEIPILYIEDDRAAMAQAALAVYNDPTKRVSLYGTTGTNGKTTSAYLLQSIFEAAGLKAARIGTLGWSLSDKSEALARTTPEAPDLLELIGRFADENADAVVMEVTSIAAEMKRVEGFRFRGAWFTNLTQDHLDFHGSMEAYRDAKRNWLRTLDEGGFVAVNGDDPHGREMLDGIIAKPLVYGFEEGADVRGFRGEPGPSGTELRIESPQGSFTIQSPLIGRFNDENVLGVVAVALETGIEPDAVKRGIENLRQVPGRMQRLDLEGDVHAVVDYAHTPDALERALEALRPYATGGLTVVFGAGGDRDRTKRPIMGRIAAEGADRVIVTSDNPRTEDPDAIVRDILEGIEGDHYKVVVDRREAIRYAIETAQVDEIVLVAGKGHEDYQIIGEEKLHFDDREEVLKVRPLAKGEPA